MWKCSSVPSLKFVTSNATVILNEVKDLRLFLNYANLRLTTLELVE